MLVDDLKVDSESKLTAYPVIHRSAVQGMTFVAFMEQVKREMDTLATSFIEESMKAGWWDEEDGI